MSEEEGKDRKDAGPEEEEEQQPSERPSRTDEQEAVVGGVIEEESESRARPLIYDVLGGVVLLLVILAGLYIYIGGGGGEGQLPETRQFERPERQADTGDEAEQPVRQQPQVEEWSPAEFKMPPPRQADDVDVALEEAQASMDAGRLIEPEGNNALESFRSVLESEPDNEAAQAGIDEIVNQLISQANEALDEGRVRDALEQVSAIEAIRSDAEGLDALQERVVERREVIELLSAASEDLQAGRLVTPEDDSALAQYRRVLELDEDNADARQGLINVERLLLEQATTAARERDFEEAERLLGLAEGVRESEGAVPETRQNIQEFRGQSLEQLQNQARQAIEAENYSEADELLTQAEAIAPDNEAIESLRQELTRARVYARYSPGDRFRDEFAGGDGQSPEMVVLPVGSYRMGSPEGEEGRRSYEGPRHQVTFSNGFAVSRTEITVGEFRQFVEATGYTTDAERSGSSSIYSEDSGRVERRDGIYWIHDFHGDRADANLPVIHVSWNDARAYAQWLSDQTGQSYRLPSEAEWEYAVRGGTSTAYWWGSGSPEREVENLTGEDDRSDAGRQWNRSFDDYGDDFWGPSPAGSFEANPFGLMDIGGNVSEWVQDCWHDSYARAPADGSAWVNQGCERRVVRGGSWGSPPDRTRSAYRISGSPTTHTTQVGFRVAKDL